MRLGVKGEERSALVRLEDASLVRRWLDTDQPRRARKGYSSVNGLII
jgi:hypothetical protein